MILTPKIMKELIYVFYLNVLGNIIVFPLFYSAFEYDFNKSGLAFITGFLLTTILLGILTYADSLSEYERRRNKWRNYL